ncbi:MAG: hypothetical protein GQ527_03870, partial [Bacteroidales bacterium]|nr:hypothetical protein [Bacteroidales bacterium]
MNKLKDIDHPEQEEKKAKKAHNFFARYIRPILDGSIISRERTEKNFLFI